MQESVAFFFGIFFRGGGRRHAVDEEVDVIVDPADSLIERLSWDESVE